MLSGQRKTQAWTLKYALGIERGTPTNERQNTRCAPTSPIYTCHARLFRKDDGACGFDDYDDEYRDAEDDAHGDNDEDAEDGGN